MLINLAFFLSPAPSLAQPIRVTWHTLLADNVFRIMQITLSTVQIWQRHKNWKYSFTGQSFIQSMPNLCPVTLIIMPAHTKLSD